MDITEAYKKIDRHIKRNSGTVLIVDVQNKASLDELVQTYKVQQNKFIAASDSDFCAEDELPVIAKLIAKLQREDGNFFVRELASLYYLKGINALSDMLVEMLHMDVKGRVVVITYQCKKQLEQIIEKDSRMDKQIAIIDGRKTPKPKLIFTTKGITLAPGTKVIKGVQSIASAVEGELADKIYVETAKEKEQYSQAIYLIADMKDPYEILCQKDRNTEQLDRSLGTDDDWKYALDEFGNCPTWEELISAKVGNYHSLNSAMSNYKSNKSNKHWLWLYLVGLKLFGAENDWCLSKAALDAGSVKEFVQNIYRKILNLAPHDKIFATVYERRKAILNDLNNPAEEVSDFCKIVLSKERDAIYYLTDNTEQERELVFKLMARYNTEYSAEELADILKVVYPDICDYLRPYHFNNELLDGYFQEYKYQKLINKILPQYMQTVEEQAVSRDYNTLLPARSAIVEKLDCEDTQSYFTDAMGVEYLGFILAKCSEMSLMAKVSVCRCELPSITSRNKEFFEALSTENLPIKTVSDIDEIKHNGEDDYEYRKTKLPIHLMKELATIDGLLRKISTDLCSGKYSKAILISDHGASRLAVIHETENLIAMAESGNHSGRCCPKNEVDTQPENAVDAGDFWALANYDRFKGSRKANIEVHGGATLEEIAVPVIELTYFSGDVEVKLMPIDAAAALADVPVIKASRRNPAGIKIYISQKMMDVSVEIDGHRYAATKINDNFYQIDEMKEIYKPKTYYVNVLACGNNIASGLQLKIKAQGMSEKSIL